MFVRAIRLSILSPLASVILIKVQRLRPRSRRKAGRRGSEGRTHYRWYNEGNAAGKLVSDTDCGGIDSNEPLGDALNVSLLVNPVLAQRRNAKTMLSRRMDLPR